MEQIKYLPMLQNDESKVIKTKDIVNDMVEDLTSIEDTAVRVDLHLRLVKLSSAFAEVLKDGKYKNFAIEAFDEEASRLSQAKLEIDGSTISKATVHTAYDFTKCNHPLLDFLNNVTAKFKDMRKEIETKLKAIPESESILVDDVPTIIGGNEKIILDIPSIVAKLQFVINDAQTLVDTIESVEYFTVNRPVVIRTTGLKVLRK